MKPDIVIYNDEGVGAFGLLCLQKFFAGHEVWLCDANAVIDGTVFGLADVFVMPGGADMPYGKKLNGRGNVNIRAFVEGGGTYVGICAGAYYGCSALEFHQGRADEITGPRELAFTDAIACGSLHSIAPPYDLTLKSAAAARIVLPNNDMLEAFYHGGPSFRLGADDTDVLARYDDVDGKPPAIIERNVGDGRALLVGVHLETGADDLADYPVKDESERPLLDAIVGRIKSSRIQPRDVLRQLIGDEYA